VAGLLCLHTTVSRGRMCLCIGNSSIDRGGFYVTKVVAQASRVTCIDKRANREQTAHKSIVKEF